MFALYAQGKITKAAIGEILRHAAKEPESAIVQIIKVHSLEKICANELEKLWKKEGLDISRFMEKYRLVVDASELMKIAGKK